MAFHRPARVMVPSLPEQQRFELPTPPTLPEKQSIGTVLMTLLMPLLMSVSMAGYMITFGRPLLIVLGIAFVFVSVGATIGMRYAMRSASRKTLLKQRLRYRAHLADARESARQIAQTQREIAAYNHPSPDRLYAIATTYRRVWERRVTDPDFLRVRLGAGRAPLAVPIEFGRLDPMTGYDRDALADARAVVDKFGTVGRQPAVVDLAKTGVLGLVGPSCVTRSQVRALLCQVAVLHAPDDVVIAVRAGEPSEWEWATWLPHAFEPGAVGEAGVVPLVAEELDGIADFLEAELQRRQENWSTRRTRYSREDGSPADPHLLVVLDGHDPSADWARSTIVKTLLTAAGPDLGITVVVLSERDNQQPTRVDVRVHCGDNGRLHLDGHPALVPTQVLDAVPDLPDAGLAEVIARTLAPLSLTEESDQVLARNVSLPSMIAGALEGEPGANWVAVDDEKMLRLPVGIDGDGQPVVLDLKESAQGGIGPHGLCVGATGSGKSEFLRTLVTGLAITHSPEHLSFVLVDFKGGATFAQHTELPHVAGVITNLADDLSLVDRVKAALGGEQERRQQMLRDAGNVDSLREYQLRQAAGHTDVHGRPLEPLPYLMVIVDEFGELLSARPDFIELFVQIGRVGRSLGIHLLLATQRLEEGRLRGLESHLSYRICLRTFSAAESRAAIGSPDAYTLPSIPGSAYLKVDESVFLRFRVAHISGPYISREQRVAADAGGRVAEIVHYGFRVPPQPDDAREQDKQKQIVAPTGPTEMQVAINRLKSVGSATHQVWLPPLPQAMSLDTLLGPAAPVRHRGLAAGMWPYPGVLKFPVALIDLPNRQQQQPLVMDFAGQHGNVAIVGAPQTGRSTMLRSTLLSAMLTNTPEEAQFYCVDFGGGGLHHFEQAPHVGGVAGRTDPDRVRRMLADVRGLVIERERLFRELAVDSIAMFRAMRDSGRLPAGVPAADVFLVIDNWAAVRAEHELADAYVMDVLARGLGVGVHVILSASRWLDIKPNLRDAINARLELRLGDPTESEVNRQLAKQLPQSTPGRGVASPGVYFQAALPRMDGSDDANGLRTAEEEIIATIARTWSGPVAPEVRILPELISAADLIAATDQHEPGVPLGIAEDDLAPVGVDLTVGDPHLVVLGDTASGKTSALRLWMRGLTARQSSADVRFIVIDYRRSLLDIVPEDYIGAYASDPNTARAYIGDVVAKLAERLPPPDITPRQLRSRDWWAGPEIYVVVDDYDLVGGGAQAPLAALVDCLPQARDVGLHLVLARRTGGAGRALTSDPVLSRVRDLGTAGLLLSGNPQEGPLLGGDRAQERPAGRGVLIRRGAPATLVQVAFDDEDVDDEALADQARYVA
ncbi:MAG TPA: type VII secretion protein EccCb [Pseudonocardiaceae bacterium]